ncbi:PREDICTED: gametocyte-specific factor 1 homolog [Rhagoletis zephyria]|uniref:gametocyte-specific factor 1 homolog n=1 Tax=Rhagoletis zephyria TaxID=28612 RepID=UPI000811285B|nr:PREDICTED: gametocyte-specific factor 1 homolog [Rhagoletis zephyria]XP_036320415.1 gametocyte-specific factor 1 homolog [Rhagoletis pomonella]
MISCDGEYEQCPYDISHTILKKRFQVHLGRCRKNHKGVQKVTCPFNVTHILNQPELDWHVKTCPERASFENFKHQQEVVAANTSDASCASTSTASVAEQETEYVLETEENWDDLPPTPSYDPKKYAANAQVLRTLQGHSKSVKKQFRAKERLRLKGIEDA